MKCKCILFFICLAFGLFCLIAPQPSAHADEVRKKLNASIQRLIALIGDGENQLTPAEVVAAASLLRRSMRNEKLTEPEAEWKRRINQLIDQKLDVTGYRQAISTLDFTGLLEVESSPPGAAIVLDGKETDWVTPHTLSVSTGEHQVGVKLSPAYEVPNSQTVPVKVNQRAYIDFTLSPVGYGTLLVGSRPFGAIIYLDGKRMGDTPQKLYKIRAGQYHLRLVKDDTAYSATIEVQPDRLTKIIGELSPSEP